MSEKIADKGEAVKGPEIFRALSAIMAEVTAVSKDKRNKDQGYQFRGIDDVYNAVNPLLGKYGVFCVPCVTGRVDTDGTTKAGGIMRRVILSVTYRIYASDGSSIEGHVQGEGMDTSDKATNKAMAAAHKYFLMQTFCLPTEDMEDGDHETPEPVRHSAPKPTDTDYESRPMLPGNPRPEPKAPAPVEPKKADPGRAAILADIAKMLEAPEVAADIADVKAKLSAAYKADATTQGLTASKLWLEGVIAERKAAAVAKEATEPPKDEPLFF